MKSNKKFKVALDYKSYVFYNEISLSLKRPIEEILSDTLYKYVDIVMRKLNEETENEPL